MNTQAIELTEASEPRTASESLGLATATKAALLVFLLAFLYLRLLRRKRSRDRICGRCGHREPMHRTSCTKCSSPLTDSGLRGGRRPVD